MHIVTLPPLVLALHTWQSLFFSFFKTLIGKEIAVELKNDVALTGTKLLPSYNPRAGLVDQPPSW